MNYKKFLTIVLIVLVTAGSLTCFIASGNSDASAEESSSSESASVDYKELDLENLFTNRDLTASFDEESAENIVMSESNSNVNITEEGIYIISGSCKDGSVTVNTDDTAKVQLVLNNLTLTSNSTAAIYVENADKVFITTAKGTTNILTTSGEFVSDGETNIDGVIFSKDDITLNGSGTLNINTDYGNGVVSKDDLKITSGTYNINVSNKGVEANDSIRITEAELNISADNDTIHSDGSVAVKSGTLNLESGDDGIHADYKTFILGGEINITKSYELIEGTKIYISGGTINGIASDDGINASSAKDSEDTQDGRMGKMGIDEVDEDALISISGGIININVEGDGIDSNGSIEISGGEVYVQGPTNNGNGALDYNGTAKITGGTLVALGASGMAQNMSEASQGSILITFTASYTGKTSVTDSSGNEILSFNSNKSFNSVVVSSPELKEGETYTITVGEVYQTVTLDDYIYGGGNNMMNMR